MTQPHFHTETQWLSFAREPLLASTHVARRHTEMVFPPVTDDEMVRVHIHSHNRDCPSDPPKEGGVCRYDLRIATQIEGGSK